jgi:hypothetical protein
MDLVTPFASKSVTVGVRTFALALFFVAVPRLTAQDSPLRYTNDNSDWWSLVRTDASGGEVAVQNREPAPSNFKILDVDLGHDLFSKAAAKLGKAQSIDRGDASTGRSQICYASLQDHPKRIYLVFETGEVSDLFYLFADGPDWKGSDLCAKSNLVTMNLSVASGLRLGQTPAEVRAVLGKPSAMIANKIIYSYGVEKKTSSGDFDRLRQQHPELSEDELHRNYEFYSLGVYIEARFVESKLSYLAVSKTEAY